VNGPAQEETPRFGTLRAIAALSCLFGSLGIIIGVMGNHGIATLGLLTGVGVSVGALGALVAIPLVGRQRQAVPISRQVPRSLRWVRYVLPICEGHAWVAEVNSVLAEEPDHELQRRYRRGYRRSLPELFWGSWSLHLSCRCPCRDRGSEMAGEKPPRRLASPEARPTDPPLWRLAFLLLQGRDGQWWRGLLLLTVAGMILVGALLAASRAEGTVILVVTALILSRLWHER
jgi:hypothetical protein